MSYGKQERHDENPHRHSNYEFPGGASEATVKRIAAGGGCPCASGVAHGAVTTEDDIEACFSYPITLENSLTSFVAAPAPSSKRHTVSWSAEDQWWESEDIVTNLLASDPEELGDQTYRWRMTMTDPTTNRENVVLILYRVEPEGEDIFEELIPAGAGNPLCVFKNVGFVEPLTGFKLDRFQRVDPDLGLRWPTGCKVCVGVVVPNGLECGGDFPQLVRLAFPDLAAQYSEFESGLDTPNECMRAPIMEHLEQYAIIMNRIGDESTPTWTFENYNIELAPIQEACGDDLYYAENRESRVLGGLPEDPAVALCHSYIFGFLEDENMLIFRFSMWFRLGTDVREIHVRGQGAHDVYGVATIVNAELVTGERAVTFTAAIQGDPFSGISVNTTTQAHVAPVA